MFVNNFFDGFLNLFLVNNNVFVNNFSAFHDNLSDDSSHYLSGNLSLVVDEMRVFL